MRDMTGQHQARMEALAGSGFSTATDLADWLVRVLKMPFRDAHHVTGQLVRLAEQQECDLAELTLADMQSVEPRITEDIFDVLTVTPPSRRAPAMAARRPAMWPSRRHAGWRHWHEDHSDPALPRGAGRLRAARRAHPARPGADITYPHTYPAQ